MQHDVLPAYVLQTADNGVWKHGRVEYQRKGNASASGSHLYQVQSTMPHHRAGAALEEPSRTAATFQSTALAYGALASHTLLRLDLTSGRDTFLERWVNILQTWTSGKSPFVRSAKLSSVVWALALRLAGNGRRSQVANAAILQRTRTACEILILSRTRRRTLSRWP
jgi:hypothetical protein